MFEWFYAKCKICGHKIDHIKFKTPFKLKGKNKNCIVCKAKNSMVWVKLSGKDVK